MIENGEVGGMGVRLDSQEPTENKCNESKKKNVDNFWFGYCGWKSYLFFSRKYEWLERDVKDLLAPKWDVPRALSEGFKDNWKGSNFVLWWFCVI